MRWRDNPSVLYQPKLNHVSLSSVSTILVVANPHFAACSVSHTHTHPSWNCLVWKICQTRAHTHTHIHLGAIVDGYRWGFDTTAVVQKQFSSHCWCFFFVGFSRLS